ncbi:MAG TPA: hypothetical protein VFB36_07550 [Nevskiaceae bacterium]|nr:hypothetical protein [Nevskiaceae bacterium]
MWIVLSCLAVASSGADAATVYRCHTSHGVSYQDAPCRGKDYTQNLVQVGEPSVVKSTRADHLGEWVDRLAQDNRTRELHAREIRLQRENEADTAEFAAMVEAQPDQAQQSQQEYRDRIERRNAQMRDAQAELNQYEQR